MNPGNGTETSPNQILSWVLLRRNPMNPGNGTETSNRSDADNFCAAIVATP